jgi:putative PEP-CTERM system TPR-repeat lipoprotein
MKSLWWGLCLSIALAGCDRFVSAETRLERAEAAVAKGDHRTAVVELMNALRKEPQLPGARLLFAESVLWLGDANGAQRELALVKDGDPARRAELEVRIALASGRAADALKRLDEPALPMPAPKRDLYRGIAHLQMQDPEEAVRHFGAAAAADPTLLSARTGLLEARAARGERAEAIEGLRGLTREHPESAAVWSAYGIQLAGHGDTTAARAALARAIELAPRQLEVSRQVMLLAALVEVRLLDGKLDEARESAQALERIAPRSPLSLYVGSRISMAANDYATAVTQLRDVVESSPGLLQARLLLSLALIAQGNLGQASQELNSLLEIAPQHPGARQVLAQVRMRLDDPDGALRMLVPALGTGADAQVNALIGAARSQLGAERSVQLLEEMLAKEPGNEGARVQLASAYLQAKQPAKAAKLLREGGSADETGRAALLLAAIEASEGGAAARAKVDALVAANPGNPYLATLAASYYAQAGDVAAGRAVLTRALEKGAEPAALLLARAQLEWSSGAHAQAEATLARLLELQPRNALAHTAAGEIALAEGNAAQARTHFEVVLRERPESLDARLRLVQVALNERDAARADTLAAEALKLAPANAELRDALGQAYLASGRADQALTHFRAATEIGAQDPSLWLNLARTQRVLGQAGAARESAQKSLTLRADWLPAVAMLAVMDLEARQPEAAYARVAALKKASPPSAAVLMLEGDVFAAGQREADASTSYRAAYALEPSAPTAMKDYHMRIAAKLPEPAQLLERWSATYPADLNAHLLLADAAMRTGNRAKATSHYQRILEARPDSVVVLNNLAWLYFQSGDPRAVSLARQAVKLAPKLAAANDTLGWLLINDGKAAEAMPYLETAITQAGADAEIRYHHAVGLARSGAPQEAQRRLEALLREGGQFESRSKAERLLQELSQGRSGAG